MQGSDFPDFGKLLIVFGVCMGVVIVSLVVGLCALVVRVFG